jgi:hypothetical protein
MVTSQDSAAFHRALEATGMQTGRNLILKHREKPDTNAHLFKNDNQTVFLSYIASTHAIQNLREEKAVLMMENCFLHLSPIVIEFLLTARVWIVTFAPHTT